MLESFLGVVLKVALRLANVTKFTLVAQSIGHQVGTTQLVLYHIVKLQ